MSKKYCSHCGYELRENVRFCPNCGTVVSENAERQEIEDEEPRRNSKSLYALLIVLGAILLIICGAVYFSDSQERREARLAREKFVADSLEQVRKDSIKLAEQKEQERIEVEKHTEFRKKFTFGNFIALLKNHDNASYAQKCGLSLIYKDIDDADEGEVSCEKYVYGYDVEKGENNRVEAKSNYSCYLSYNLDSSTHAAMYFKDASDADYFQTIAKEYGLLVYDGSKFVPQKKMPSGYHNVDSLDWEGDYAPTYMISDTSNENGWYVVYIGIDF